MRILGYGEDSLTYWALSRHMRQVIGPPPLNDDSPIARILFVYRPSLGRAGGRGSAQFGEFDAIVGTPRAVYLIESKWTGERITNQKVVLAGTQLRRHEVFRWIRDRWLAQRPANWSEFYSANSNCADFEKKFDGKRLVRPGHRLASNLEYVLQELHRAGCSALTKDVLLFFYLRGSILPDGVAHAPEFAVVSFPFEPLNREHGGRIIEM